MGDIVYVFTSAHDPAAIYKNESLSMNPWLVDMMHQFGASSPAVQAMWSKVPVEKDQSPMSPGVKLRGWRDQPVKEVCLMLFRALLNPGGHLDTMLDVLLGTIRQRMTWDAVPEHLTLSKTADTCDVSLSLWVQHVLLEGATRSFFGDALMKLEPRLLDSFAQFDETSWKLSYRIPDVFAKDCKSSKAIAEQALGRFFDLPIEERADTSLVILEIENVLRAAGIDSADMGILVLMFYWVINANAWKAAFWMLTHVINDEYLRSTICEEINPYVSPNADSGLSSTELANKLQTCPTFMAAYHEALRISSSSMTVRFVMEESSIRGFNLQKGARMIIPYRQVMLDESVYGEGSDQFNHERFLKNPGLLKSINYKPFGGGVTLCPGRALAQKEVLTFVALALGKFRVKLPAGKGPSCAKSMPEMNTRTPCLGIMGPETGDDIAVTLSKPLW